MRESITSRREVGAALLFFQLSEWMVEQPTGKSIMSVSALFHLDRLNSERRYQAYR